ERPVLAAGAAGVLILLVVLIAGPFGDESIEDMLVRADEYAEADDPELRATAEELAQEVLVLEPSNARALSILESIRERSAPTSPDSQTDAQQTRPPTAKEQPVDDKNPARVTRLLAEAEAALNDGRLTRPVGGNALAGFQRVLKMDPDNARAKEGIEIIRERLFDEISSALDNSEMGRVELLLSDARGLGLSDTERYASLSQQYIDAKQGAREQTKQIATLLQRGRDHLEADRLSRPADDNALASFRAVLALDPANDAAQKGITDVARRYLELAGNELKQGDPVAARGHLENAIEIAPDLPGVRAMEERIIDEQTRLASLPEPQTSPEAQVPEPVEEQPAPPARRGSDQPIKVASLPDPNLTGSESATALFERAEANLKINKPLLAYALYKEVLAREPDHRGARRRLYLGAQQYVRLASRDIGNNDLASARKQLSLAIAIDPAHPELDAVQRAYWNSLENRDAPTSTETAREGLAELRVKLLLSAAEKAEQRFKLDPGNRFALQESVDNYQEVLTMDPDNGQADAALDRLGEMLVAAGQDAVEREAVDDASWYLEKARELAPEMPGIARLAEALEAL
ncbi:MAG: hypothetical protein R3200_16050, partial [Xanthomonadales bacterium]|nr:hypothetical protein [Xanthomonadales bacterium]